MSTVSRPNMASPAYVTAPPVAGAPHTLMAIWGEVSLRPLDRARLADLAAGRDVRAGILTDHIGNFQRSASTGLPVYQVTGGAGYVWAASWDQAGRGTLRFLTIDASRLAPSSPNAGQDVASKSPSDAFELAVQPVNSPNVAPAATSRVRPRLSRPLRHSNPPRPCRAQVVAAQPTQPDTSKSEIPG